MNIFKYNGEIVEYVLERKKIKNCYISIKDAIVTIKVPNKTSKKRVNELIEKRAEWIIKNVEKQKRSAKFPKQYVNGEIFKVLGKNVLLEIYYENIKKIKFKYWLGKFIVILPIEYKNNQRATYEIKKILDKFYTKLAEKEIDKAMRKMTLKVGIAPNHYTIKNLKSTWGNCSTTANISINKDIIMYSRHAIEYVCLHEICHLENMNHSKKFWDSIETYMPDYKKAEEELKM